MQEQPGGDQLADFKALTIRAFRGQTSFFLADCGAYFKDLIALFALKIIDGHNQDSLDE
jgi:hypothetical protein